MAAVNQHNPGHFPAPEEHITDRTTKECNITTALFGKDPAAATSLLVQAQPIRLSTVTSMTMLPSSLVKVEMEEDEGDPPVTLFDFKEMPE